MKDPSIMKPVFAQALLTFLLLFWMAKERLSAFRSGAIKPGEPGQRPQFTGKAGNVSNAFHNSLEMPVLFFAGIAFAILTDSVDWELTALAWAYVACRYVQALIHGTYNHIPHRFLAFLASNVALIAIWVNIALHVFLGW